MKYLKYLKYLIFFFIASCSVASEIVNDEVSVLNTDIKIVQDNGKCYLVHKQSKTQLTPKPPCHFLRNSNHSPQFYSYPKTGVEATLIVSGTPISDSIRKQWGISHEVICGFESQGVLIIKSKVIPTTKTLQGGVLCRDQGSDEKNYRYFAH